MATFQDSHTGIKLYFQETLAQKKGIKKPMRKRFIGID